MDWDLGLTHLGELEMWWAWKAKYLLDEHHIALVDGGRSMGKSKSQTLHSPCKLVPSRRVWRRRSGSCANSLLLFHRGAFPPLEIKKSIPATLVVCFKSESLHESSKNCRLLTDVKFAPGIWNSTSWLSLRFWPPSLPSRTWKPVRLSLSIWVTLNVSDDLMYIDIDIDIVWHICSGMSPWSWAAPPCPRQLERWPGSPGGLQVTDNGASIHCTVHVSLRGKHLKNSDLCSLFDLDLWRLNIQMKDLCCFFEFACVHCAWYVWCQHHDTECCKESSWTPRNSSACGSKKESQLSRCLDERGAGVGLCWNRRGFRKKRSSIYLADLLIPQSDWLRERLSRLQCYKTRFWGSSMKHISFCPTV